jgi:hypothetical protein
MADQRKARLNDRVNFVHPFKGTLCAAYVTEVMPGELYGLAYNDPDYDSGYKQMPVKNVRYDAGRSAGTFSFSEEEMPTDKDPSILDSRKDAPKPKALDTSVSADKVVR